MPIKERVSQDSLIYRNPKLDEIAKSIGNTPLIKVNLLYKGDMRVIYAKLECNNFSGSIKDRMAFYIIGKSYKNGSLKPGDEIVEATSGNTGIAFAALGTALGHPVRIFMPDWMSQERKSLISSYGAEIESVSFEAGGFLESIAKSIAYAKVNEAVFLPSQFDNVLNINAHEKSTAPEIESQLASIGLKMDAFVAGVGTGGTVMGLKKYAKKHIPTASIHPLEPASSPTLSTGYKVGTHRIQGISDEFIPSILNLGELDEIIEVDDSDAIIMAQKLAKELGLGLGISSGANLLGALKVQELKGSDANVVTIFCDCNKKYLSTDLMKKQEVKANFLAPKVELLNYELIEMS